MELKKPSGITWHRRTSTILGSLNLGFASVGLGASFLQVTGFLAMPRWFIREEFPSAPRYFWESSAISLVLLVLLVCSGVMLLRRSKNARVVSNIAYLAEILGFAVAWWRWGLPFSPISAVSFAVGFTNVAIGIQVLTAYPVIALILLNTVRERAPAPT